MTNRRRSRSVGNDSFKHSNEINGLKDKLEQSSVIGQELLDELRGLKENKQILEDEINTLQNVNTTLAVKLGESATKNRRLTITFDRVLEESRESQTREDQLTAENQALHSQLEQTLSVEKRNKSVAEMTTPRDIRISPPDSPRPRARGTTLPPDVYLLANEDFSFIKKNNSNTTLTRDDPISEKSPSPRQQPIWDFSNDTNGGDATDEISNTESDAIGDSMALQLGIDDLIIKKKEEQEEPKEQEIQQEAEESPKPDIPDSGPDTSDIDSTPGDTMAAQLMVDGMCFGFNGDVDNNSFNDLPPTPPTDSSPIIPIGTPNQSNIPRGTPTTPPVTPSSQAIQYQYQHSSARMSVSTRGETPPTEELPSPFRKSVSGIRRILSPKGKTPGGGNKNKSPAASPSKYETPPLVLIERVADAPVFGGSVVPGWGSLPVQASTPSTTVELCDSDSDSGSDYQIHPSSLASDRSKRNCIAVENYCDSGANSIGLPFLTTSEFELSAWASSTTSALSVQEVIKVMTVVEDVPSLKEFESLIKQKSPKRDNTRPQHHSTMYCLRQTIKCFLIELKGKLSSADPSISSNVQSRQLGIELRRIEKELGIVADRFSDGSIAKSIEIVMRDYQHLRTLEGELLRQLHDLSLQVSPEKLERARYQSCLIREQKIVIKQKAYILKSQHLGQFYGHLQKCFSAFFLIMRAFKFFPLSSKNIPSRIRNFVELLYDLLPQTAILFESGLSIAHQSEPKSGAYSKFTLSDIDLVVDATAMTLCKKHEQQLSMLTCNSDVNSSGIINAADWCIAVVIESVRRGRSNPCFPLADQMVAWVSGHKLLYEPGSGMAGRKPRVLVVEDRMLPSVEIGLAGWKIPKDGQVVTAPPSHHLSWTAEGLFRCCGVRSYDGELFGILEAPRQMSFPNYGFKTDSQQYARECKMSSVTSLMWGSTPSDVWLDDSEFLALNPILFIFSSPIPYTLLALPPPITLSGGLLVQIPYTASDDSSSCSSVKPMRSWSSRTGIIAARRTGNRR